MMLRNLTRVIVVLATTAAFAQSTPPGTGPTGAPLPIMSQPMGQRRGMPARAGATAKENPNSVAVLRQRVDDMESTINQMHGLLMKMQAKQAKSGVKDSLAKANLDMWGLMVGQMDKELQELRLALAQREDMEARRAALYKQADAKAEAEAQAARAAMAAKFAGTSGAATGQATAPGTATPAPAASSPATPATSPN